MENTTKKKNKQHSKSKSKSKKKLKKKQSPSKTSGNLINTLSIYLGTYEGKIIVNNIDIKSKSLTDNFSFSSSQNAIRTIYHKDNSLFVSGLDEIIHIFDIKQKTSEGDLMTYSGSINDIKVHDNYLIVAGDEVTIPIWRMKDFNNILELKGHKKSINCFDIHSSGGFLVSCSKDQSVIFFDLLTGRKVKKFEFDYICNKVELFNKDNYLLLVFDLHIFIMDLMKNINNKNDKDKNNENNILKKINFSKKIINAYIVKNKLIVVFSDSEIKTYDLSINEEEKENKENIENVINLKSEISLFLEKPQKKDENDLDIKARFISISKIEKIKIITISYSNNEVFFYDLNKIVKYEELNENKTKENSNKIIKRYGKLEYSIPGKITALDTQLIKI